MGFPEVSPHELPAHTVATVSAIGVWVGDRPEFYPVGSSRQFACLFNRTDTGALVGKVWGEVQDTHGCKELDAFAHCSVS